MPPPPSEHALLTLLGQFFSTQKCLSSRIHRRALSIAFSDAALPIRPSQLPRVRQPTSVAIQDQQIESVTPNTPNAERLVASLPTRHAGPPSKEVKQIAVLGGGITGLATAHWLARELPNSNITIYEAEGHLGGWLSSNFVDFNGPSGKSKVLFERGPRTLRPLGAAASVTINMIEHLGLHDQIIISSKKSAAARNRYIYYPDHLVLMPGPGQPLTDMIEKLVTEPAFTGLWKVLLEPFRPTRPNALQDESVGSFLDRRLGGSDIGNNIVSAVLHGIYAGDVNQLSARSLLSTSWCAEGRFGSVAKSFWPFAPPGYTLKPHIDSIVFSDPDLGFTHKMVEILDNASIYTFKQGIQTLATALEQSLRANRNVHFKMKEKVTGLQYDQGHIKVKTSRNMAPAKFDNVVSTVSGNILSTISPKPIPSLASIQSVTVMVVNLFYSDPDLLPVHGFGYLIPQTVPYEQNPELALGVVFDSDAIQGQDTAVGTKLTVMLGGHYWDGFDTYPDHDEAVAAAQAVLARHLGITAKPALCQTTLQKNCIPQYTVGHDQRLVEAGSALKEMYKGKLSVAGSSYRGVGLNDCVRWGRQAAIAIKHNQLRTGLEENDEEFGWAKDLTKDNLPEA